MADTDVSPSQAPETAASEGSSDAVDEAVPDWRDRTGRVTRWVRQARVDQRLDLVAGSLLAVATAVWLTSGAWGDRLPTGSDTIAHLIRSQFAIDHLLPQGRLDGWAPSFITGYQAFLFSGPAFSWAVALVQALTFGLLSVAGAFKVVFVGSFVILPVTVAFLARSFGLDRRAAGVAAVLALAVNNPFGGVGLDGLFGIGLATHQLGSIFFFLALGGAARVLRRPDPRWAVFTAVSLAVLLATHGLSVIILVVVLALLVVAMFVAPRSSIGQADLAAMVRHEVNERLRQLGIAPEEPPAVQPPQADTDVPTRRTMFRLIAAFALAGGLAAFVLVPLVAHRDLQLMFTSWGTPPLGEQIGHFWRGEIIFRPGVGALVVAGFIYGVARMAWGRRLAFPLVAVPIAFLAVAHASLHLWPGNVVPTQLTTRALGYFGVLCMLPLAALISAIGRRVGPLGSPAALGLALAVVVLPLGPTRGTARQGNEPVPAMAEAARQLALRVPEGARFATERDLSDEAATTRLGEPHMWLAWASGRPTLNSYNPESSASPGAGYEADNIFTRPVETAADALARLGVSHLVTLSDEAAERITASPRFTQVWRESPVAIFAVSASPGQPDPAALVTANAPVEARVLRAENEYLEIQVDASQPVMATVAVGWSPKWHASVDGEPVNLGKSSDGLLQLTVREGTSLVVLEFRPDIWDHLGLAITLVTVIALCGWFLFRRRLRRSGVVTSDGQIGTDSDPF